MATSNHSSVSEFILSGLTDSPDLWIILFGIFLVIYLASVLGNLGLIMLIRVSPQLHTPMYLLLSHLAFVDFSFTSSVTPNSLVNFLRGVKSMTFYACAIQVCCFITFVVCEQYLLSIMAYDWNAAICNPLLNINLKPRKLCNQIIASTYIYGFTVGFVQTVATFHLSFVTTMWSTTSTVMTHSLSCSGLFWHPSQRAVVVNHCWVQYPLLSSDRDRFLCLHSLCHPEDPFCWRKTESFFYLCFPSDFHHNILWDNHFYVPTAQVKPFSENW